MYKYPFLAIFFLLMTSTWCLEERVVVSLADGRTTRPILLFPLEHSHDNQDQDTEIAQPIHRAQDEDDPFDIPNPPSETDIVDSNNVGANTDNSEGQGGEMNEESLSIPKTTQLEMNKTPTTSAPSTTTTTPFNATSESKQTTPPPTPHTIASSSPVSPNPPKPSFRPTTLTPPTPPLCHHACLDALTSVTLYTNNTLKPAQGSDLTLICELPINPSLYVENLIWLFHSLGSPEGQCSLTTQRYLASCPGFTTVTNTDDRNATFLRQVLTLANLQENHTGEYLCQVEVKCCPGTQEHPMAQERTVSVTVSVWWADYTLDLAVAGTLAAVLIAILVGVNVWLYWQRKQAYFYLDEKQASGNTTSAVLHLPLIDDDDDSFDSNSDVQE